jgi:aminopeptidase N
MDNDNTDAKAPNVLSEKEANIRAKQVSDVHYEFNLFLKKGSETYKADLNVSFVFNKVVDTDELFFDFVGKTIETLAVNGADVSKDAFHGNRIHLKDSLLKSGEKNQMHIIYVNDFNHDGAGFHQFIDPEDKQEYLYTNFEPFDAHRLLPCFDQPNIKGRFAVTIEGPSEWKILSNDKCVSSKSSGDLALHTYQVTPLMSTYLFAIVAGPYEEWHDTYNNGEIPLGLYARKSQAKHLEHEEIFEITKQGFKFYGEFFDYKYPFTKYDQVFAPEFNQGAMENIGLVTFNEHYTFKETPTTYARANRADTILHEMAHMWFGNLVTPVWWDGLWLNESFATYMAAHCVCEATKFGQVAWQVFNSTMKEWAYREDQLSTTHPIQGEVADTDQTLLNFDGITYGKGASLLKQLVSIVGVQGFKLGMVYYFKKYQWKNTVIDDFLDALEHGAVESGRKGVFNAREWSKEWLQTAGLNSLIPVCECKSGKIHKFCVHQAAPTEHPTLRKHHLEVALFDYTNNKVTLRKKYEIDVLPQVDTELPGLAGEDEPAFVYINYNDHGFAKCLLDEKSEAFVRAHLNEFEDDLLRQLLWASFYVMVRDCKLKSTNYVDLVLSQLGKENDSKLVQAVMRRCSVAATTFMPRALRETYSDKLFDFCWTQIQTATEKDFQIIWADNLISFAESKRSVSKLAEVLEKNEGKPSAHYAFNQTHRWRIVVRAVAWKIESADQLLEKEKARDNSDVGDRMVRTAQFSRWDAEVKQRAWERFLSVQQCEGVSVWQLEAEMSGFRWEHQDELLRQYTDKFFEVVRNVFKNREKEFADAFFGSFFPFYPEDAALIERVKQLLSELDADKEKVLQSRLKEELDDLIRARDCRALASQK